MNKTHAYLKLPIDVFYTADSDTECEDCFERAENLGVSPEAMCPDCYGDKDKEFILRNVYIPLDDIKEIIIITDNQIQLQRHSDDSKLLVNISEEDLHKKLLKVANIG